VEPKAHYHTTWTSTMSKPNSQAALLSAIVQVSPPSVVT